MIMRYARDGVHPGVERDGGRQQRTHPHVAFLEFRQELRAEPDAEIAQTHDEDGGTRERDAVSAARRREQEGAVDPRNRRTTIVSISVTLIGQQDRRQHRRDGEGGETAPSNA